MRNIQDKRALVTGAASGIGRAVSIQLARQGADLMLLDVNPKGLADVADQLKGSGRQIITRQCDVRCREQLSDAVGWLKEHWGELHILVNNAGVAYYGPTDEMTEQQWDWLLEINLHAPIHLTRMLLPMMLRQTDAHIVNVSSMYGLFPGRRLAAYNTSKFALQGFTESLRMEYGRAGLGVTAICPGFVRTPFFEATATGKPEQSAPTPPGWICTTSETVAARVVRAIHRDQRAAVITPLAHLLYGLRRLTPGLIDRLHRFGRRRNLRRNRARLLQQSATGQQARRSAA